MTKSTSTPIPKLSKQFTSDKSASNGGPFAIELTNSGAKSQKSGALPMSNSQLSPNIQIINNQPMTSSLDVAAYFGKQHKDVLRAIQNLDIPNDFNQRNFALVEYVDAKGEKRKAYNMTRDGFVILVMGFTGKEAMQWKIRYIQAFNAMEASLKRIGQTPALPLNIPLLPVDIPLADLDLTEIYDMMKANCWAKVELVDGRFMISSKTVANRLNGIHKPMLRHITALTSNNKKLKVHFKLIGPDNYDIEWPPYPEYFYMDKEGFWMASEALTINKHSRFFIKKALEQFNKLEAALLRLKCEAWELLRDAEIERRQNLPVPAPEPEVAEAKFVPADPWSSAEKDCQEAFKAYLEAGGVLRSGDDYMKGISHSIGMLLALSFKLQSDLWTHRKVRLETKKLIGCN